MPRTYRCKAHDVVRIDGVWRMKFTILEDHPNGMPAGSVCGSSKLRSIDFERGIAVSNNSIYIFDPSDLAS